MQNCVLRQPLPGMAGMTKIWLVMKLTVVLLVAFSIQASAKLHAQEKVSISVKNATLESVLKDIRRQTGYSFAFQDQWKEISKRIDISVNNVSIEDALAICFKDQPFTYAIVNKTIIVKEKVVNPKVQMDTTSRSPVILHGRVVDENNQPVAGVTVSIKGTKTATSTDDNGEFI